METIDLLLFLPGNTINDVFGNSLGSILAAGYAVLCVAAGVQVVFNSKGAELSGVLLLILGLPWSLLVTVVLVATRTSSAWAYAIGFLASCGVNGWLLWRLGAWVANRRALKGQG